MEGQEGLPRPAALNARWRGDDSGDYQGDDGGGNDSGDGCGDDSGDGGCGGGNNDGVVVNGKDRFRASRHYLHTFAQTSRMPGRRTG